LRAAPYSGAFWDHDADHDAIAARAIAAGRCGGDAAQPGDAALPARARLRTIACARSRLAGCRQAILQSVTGIRVFRGLNQDLLFL